jgi:hypothetical protein
MKLKSFISEFCEQKIPKSKALTGILGLLKGDATLAAFKKGQAVDLYNKEHNFIHHNNRLRDVKSHSEDINESVHQLPNQVSNHARLSKEMES